MPLTDDQACSVVKRMMSRYRSRIASCRSIPISEFFNACFIAAKTSKNEQAALAAVRYTLISIACNDTRPNSRSSRSTKRQKVYIKDLKRKGCCFNEDHALHLDLQKAFSCLSHSDLTLLELRVFNNLNQQQTSHLLDISLFEEQKRERKLLALLKSILSDWR